MRRRRSLEAYRDLRDQFCEALFHSVYGSPLLQALVGLKATDGGPRAAGKDPVHWRWSLTVRAEAAIPEEARARLRSARFYIRMPDGVADERGFNFCSACARKPGTA